MAKKEKKLVVNNGEECICLKDDNLDDTFFFKDIIFHIKARDFSNEEGCMKICTLIPEPPIGMLKGQYIRRTIEFYQCFVHINNLIKELSNNNDYFYLDAANEEGVFSRTVIYSNPGLDNVYTGSKKWTIPATMVLNKLKKFIDLIKNTNKAIETTLS